MFNYSSRKYFNNEKETYEIGEIKSELPTQILRQEHR